MKPRGRKYRAEQEANDARVRAEKLAALAMIGVSINAAFGVAALTRGPHWELEDHESKALAQALDSALNTLPGQVYGEIKAYVEKIVPWVSLAFIGYSVTAPRIAEDRERAKALAAKKLSVVGTPKSDVRPAAEPANQTGDGNGTQNRNSVFETDTGQTTFRSAFDTGNEIENDAGNGAD